MTSPSCAVLLLCQKLVHTNNYHHANYTQLICSDVSQSHTIRTYVLLTPN